MKAARSLISGGLGYVLGGIAATVLVCLVLVAAGATGASGTTPAEPRGGEMVFKLAWSAAVFGIGPLVAAAFPPAVAGRWLKPEALALAVVIALALYGLTAWVLITPLSSLNDCAIGIAWPDTSAPRCD
jgi:hypothetical protein